MVTVIVTSKSCMIIHVGGWGWGLAEVLIFQVKEDKFQG